MKTYNINLEEDLNENGKLMFEHLFSDDFDYVIDYDHYRAFSASQYIKAIRFGLWLAKKGYTSIDVTKVPWPADQIKT